MAKATAEAKRDHCGLPQAVPQCRGFHIEAEQEKQENNAHVSRVGHQLRIGDHFQSEWTQCHAQGDVSDDNGLACVKRNRGQHGGTEENRGESECDTRFHKISQRESLSAVGRAADMTR